MKITIEDRGEVLHQRLRERLVRAARLRCADHDQAVVAVIIHGRENGWFDSTWNTCCAKLEQEASTIIKTRC